MTVVLFAECDACHVSGPQLDADAASVEDAIAASGMVDGSAFGKALVHESCLADLERGIDPATAYGLPGMCSVDDLERR